MKNVKKYQLRSCIVKRIDEFQQDVRVALRNGAYAMYNYEDDAMEFFDDIGFCSYHEALALLSEFYGVTIDSVHVDGVDAVYVRIEYTEEGYA